MGLDLQKKTLTFGCTTLSFKHLPWRGQGGGQRHGAIGNRLASLFPIQHDASEGHWKTTEPAKKNMRQSPRPSKKDSDFWVHSLGFQTFAMEGAKGWPASCCNRKQTGQSVSYSTRRFRKALGNHRTCQKKH